MLLTSSTDRTARSVSRLEILATTLPASLSVWWLARPYAGIRHDALFYAGDALRRLHPASLGQDLFFHRLSQGDFSWYGTVYAAAITLLGLEAAGWLVTLVSRVAWCAALWLWCRTAVSSPGAARALLALVLCLPSSYGTLGALSVAEPFATPRPLAEAAVFAALALGWQGRVVAAWMLMGLAGTAHPLMALGAAAVLAWMLPARLRIAAAVLTGLSLAVLVLTGTEPFTRMTQFYDAGWWTIVATQNPMTVSSHWTASDMGHAMVALLLLIDAARCAPTGSLAARMAAGLAIACAVCLGAWGWATETRHVLLIQLQVWRVLWLVQVLAPGLWLAALFRGDIPWPSVPAWVLLAVAWCLDVPSAPMLVLLALTLVHVPAHRLPYALTRWLSPLALLLGVLFVASRIEPLINDQALAVVELVPEQSIARVLHEPVVALLLVGAIAAAAAALRPGMASAPSRRFARAIAAVTVSAAMLGWSAWIFRALPGDEALALARAADRVVRPGSTVWSDAGVRWTWLYLRRPSWVSFEQRAGALFSRDAALTWLARWSVLQSLGLSGESHLPTLPAADVVRVLCAQPGLDELLLTGARPGADAVLTAPGAGLRLSHFDCMRRKGHT